MIDFCSLASLPLRLWRKFLIIFDFHYFFLTLFGELALQKLAVSPILFYLLSSGEMYVNPGLEEPKSIL